MKNTQNADFKNLIGIVKWYNEGKGYGFIESGKLVDVFAHYTAIVGEGYKTLSEGQEVEFDLVQGKHGNQAINIRKLEYKGE